MFRNRYAEKGGVLGFRDVTGAVFPAGYSTGNGHYAQELGDMDGDGDWDILGLNWLVAVQFNDASYLNNGSGGFGAPTTLASSGSDDSEPDFLDYDEDGDLDLFIANFSGQERVYQNNGAAGYTFLATGTVLPSDGTTSLDADTCDVDSDGDTDVFVANDQNQAEWYLRNTTSALDTAPPHVVRVEQAPNRIAGAGPTVVRAEIEDNANYYTNWYLAASLSVQVNGGPVLSYPMRSSMGQVFRGEIPGTLSGNISYSVVAQDEHGNSSQSPVFAYVASGGSLGLPFCFGDGTQTVACPCGNLGTPGRGCDNSSSSGGGRLAASGAVQPDSVVFAADGLPANTLCVFLQGSVALPAPVAFGDGLRCSGGALRRLYAVNAAGAVASAPPPGAPGVRVRSAALGDLLTNGATRVYQAWYRDPSPSFCPAPSGALFNISNGLEVVW